MPNKLEGREREGHAGMTIVWGVRGVWKCSGRCVDYNVFIVSAVRSR